MRDNHLEFEDFKNDLETKLKNLSVELKNEVENIHDRLRKEANKNSKKYKKLDLYSRLTYEREGQEVAEKTLQSYFYNNFGFKIGDNFPRGFADELLEKIKKEFGAESSLYKLVKNFNITLYNCNNPKVAFRDASLIAEDYQSKIWALYKDTKFTSLESYIRVTNDEKMEIPIVAFVILFWNIFKEDDAINIYRFKEQKCSGFKSCFIYSELHSSFIVNKNDYRELFSLIAKDRRIFEEVIYLIEKSKATWNSMSRKECRKIVSLSNSEIKKLGAPYICKIVISDEEEPYEYYFQEGD